MDGQLGSSEKGTRGSKSDVFMKTSTDRNENIIFTIPLFHALGLAEGEPMHSNPGDGCYEITQIHLKRESQIPNKSPLSL